MTQDLGGHQLFVERNVGTVNCNQNSSLALITQITNTKRVLTCYHRDVGVRTRDWCVSVSVINDVEGKGEFYQDLLTRW